MTAIVTVVSSALNAVVRLARTLATVARTLAVASRTYSVIDQQMTPNVRATFPFIGRSKSPWYHLLVRFAFNRD